MTVDRASLHLPVADGPQIRAFVREVTRRHRWAMLRVLLLHGTASAAGLAAPWLLGAIIDGVSTGVPAGRIDLFAALIAVCLLAHTLVAYVSFMASIRLGEQVLAELREDFVDRVLRLRLDTVERAGTGDLVARTGRDVDHLSTTVRESVPEILVAGVTVVLTVGAVALVNPLLLPPALIALPVLWAGTRWYLRRTPRAYIAELSSYTDLLQGVTDTVEGAHTVEALGRESHRAARTDADIARSYAAERYTLWLRTVWIPSVEISYVLPVAATLLAGGWLMAGGYATLGEVTAVTLYVLQLVGPLEQMLSQVDEVMYGHAALRRLLGVRMAAEPAPASGPAPAANGAHVRVRDVRFRYGSAGPDVLHGVSLDLRPGERLAMVGPSGSGKSTLGRLIAGIHTLESGSVHVGGRALSELPLAEQRRRVSLVAQETHVFLGTVADNVAMVRDGDAAPEAVWAALEAVNAADWVRSLPEGLNTRLGSGALLPDPARTQQLALARLVLADPEVVVLDEATSLIDPRAARAVERSLNAVLTGRTVVAIAHRLQTAYDADRIAVLEAGRITELGSHAELLARDGAYASLWRTWHGDD